MFQTLGRIEELLDFVIEAEGRLLPLEIKASPRPTHRDIRHLLTFRKEYGEAVQGSLLLHDGPDTFWLHEGILATPRTLAAERIGRRIGRASEEELARVIEGLNEIVGR